MLTRVGAFPRLDEMEVYQERVICDVGTLVAERYLLYRPNISLQRPWCGAVPFHMVITVKRCGFVGVNGSFHRTMCCSISALLQDSWISKFHALPRFRLAGGAQGETA